jgi:hypothetical protein
MPRFGDALPTATDARSELQRYRRLLQDVSQASRCDRERAVIVRVEIGLGEGRTCS